MLARARRSELSLTVGDDACLAEAAASKHHEGLVVTVKARRFLPVAELADLVFARRGTAVALDRVRNPYNVGAILRTAAFFGIDGGVLGAPAPHPALHPDAVRVAEGGAEHLLIARTTDLVATLRQFRERGVAIVGGESGGGQDVQRYPFRRPTLVVLGHEREGLSERVRAECDALVCVRRWGAMDSLNVSVAAGVLLAELSRSKPAP